MGPGLTWAANSLCVVGALVLALSGACARRAPLATAEVGAPSLGAGTALRPDADEPRKPPIDTHPPAGGSDGKPLPESLDAAHIADADASIPSVHDLLGHRLELRTSDQTCMLLHRAPGSTEPELIALGMAPPCYFLTWIDEPPRRAHADGVSDGIPVGHKGDVRAWKYPSAGSVVTIIVIGGPTSSARAKRWPVAHCAGGARALLLRAGRLTLSRMTYSNELFCVEGGVDEKTFWIFAHEK